MTRESMCLGLRCSGSIVGLPHWVPMYARGAAKLSSGHFGDPLLEVC